MKQQEAMTYYRMGNNFLRKKNYPAAITSFQSALKLAPEFFKAICNLGVAQKSAGLLKEAEKTFTWALKLKPNSAIIYNNIGNVFTAMGNLEMAKSMYKRAISLHPTYKAAYYNLGQVLYFKGETKEAVETRIKLEKLRMGSGAIKVKRRIIN